MTEQPPPRPAKVSHWDRPKQPRDWRWVVGGVGRVMIALGLLMFGFVAYQLWGTGIQTAQAQRTLSHDFEKSLAGGGTTPPTSTTTTPPPRPTTTTGTLPVDTTPAPTTTTVAVPSAKPLPVDGEALARLEIPRMNLNRIVVEGAAAGDLSKGPGHFPETPLPGQLGNAAIAGHRTTHLAPFYDIDKLRPGDEIVVTTLNGRYVYHVTGTEIVAPQDYAAVIPTTDATKATLTLVSCTPRFTAKNRIVVHSELVANESDPLTAATPAQSVDATGPAATLPDEGPGTVPVEASSTVAQSVTTAATDTTAADTVPPASIPVDVARPTAATPDAFSDGWFSDTSAVAPTVLWCFALLAAGYGIYWISRKTRHYWVGGLAGFAPILVTLYFFYENVNRLLPPNL